MKNINKSIDETLPVLKEVTTEAAKAKRTARAYLSVAFGCPYEKTVPLDRIIRIVDTLFDMEICELSLGDTIGAANPVQVELMLEAPLKRFPKEKIALHFHDTRGMALANMLTAMNMGITAFDGACGGLGGCPYAPGSSGNAATDDLIYMCAQMGIETGVDLGKLLAATRWIEEKTETKSLSRNLQAAKSTGVIS